MIKSVSQISATNVEFSWKQFWITMVYENLPPVLFSPLAALLFERSLTRAWNVCQNRNLIILTSHNNPLFYVLFSWLVIYPASFLITGGLVIVLTQDIAPVGSIDVLQMIFAYSLILLRRLIFY